jgi:sortase (surface protein transpeptidase)
MGSYARRHAEGRSYVGRHSRRYVGRYVARHMARHAGRSLVVALTTWVLAATGATALGVAVVSQRNAPQPPPSAAGSVGSTSANAVIPAGFDDSRAGSRVVGPVLAASKPESIDIPAIGVESPLQYLGLTEEHTLVVPPPGATYDIAAWYKHSSTPGALGPSVIYGHVDSAAEGPSVFFNLGNLRPGHKIFVTRADGVRAVFEVDGVRSYPKEDFPTRQVYGNTDHAALRLITCGGPFDSAAGSYLENIVVYASLIGSRPA